MKSKSQTRILRAWKPKISINKSFVLEKPKGSFYDLIVIKTTKKKEMIKEIKINLESWMKNPHFDEIRKKKLDLAIVIYVDKFRMKKQDVDNIAKTVLDALRKSKKNEHKPYLFEDDSQIVRLLVYKLETKKLKGYETNSLVISFREHNPQKQMILVEQNVI